MQESPLSPVTLLRTVAAALLLSALTGVAAGQDLGDVTPPHEVAEQNRRCLECHGQEHINELDPTERYSMVAPLPGEEPPTAEELASWPAVRTDLLVDEHGEYADSMHAQTSCVDCHTDCDVLPHPYKTQPARCDECHADQVTEYVESAHGVARLEGQDASANCADCHGTHGILSHLNPKSPSYVLRQPMVCAGCHDDNEVTQENGMHLPEAAGQYIDSVHGRGLLAGGLVVAPACVNCHGVHDIRSADDPLSDIHKANVPQTCGECHTGVEAIYNESVHGLALMGGDIEGPVCTDCHNAHEIIQPGSDAFKLLSDRKCGECHEDKLKFYRESFHGKAIALGHTKEAACYDCHGYHDIQPNDHPDSHLSDANKLQTCQKCHEDAGGDFAGYLAHGNHSDKENYPALYWTFFAMTALVLGTFGFFGIHTILWTIRSVVLMLRHPEIFKEAKIQMVKDDEVYVRFRPFERFLHAMVILSFLILVATGMPLKFYYAGWAEHMVNFLGGIEATAKLHRFGAILTFMYFGMHLTSMAKALWRRREELRNPETGRWQPRRFFGILFGPDMPAPHLNDIKDLWAHQKWFFGRGPRPQFDRWTYWEKFDYLAVFWGVGVIGMSGLVLWFPEFFTRFMPGWSINIAMIIHSDEALLAAGFIFTFHFFNVHFRVEKFPIDSVIFSGRISRTEMLHERKKWFDRLEASGKLEEMRFKDDWQQWKKVIHPLGFLAFGIGLLLLGLILYATTIRLMAGGH